MTAQPQLIELNNQHFSSRALEFPTRGETKGTVVCLHGFPDTLHSFDELAPRLADAGYRVVAPALRGYEARSTVPRQRYYLSDMASDVLSWLPQISGEPVHLIGHDWGGAIGGLVATQTPLKSFTSLAIPPIKNFLPALASYPRQLRHSWYMAFFQLKGLADLRFAQSDYAFVERLWRDWSPDWRYSGTQLEQAKSAFRQPGVANAALNYYRCQLNFFSPRWRSNYQAIRQPIPAPALYLAGENDGCMDEVFFRRAVDESQFTAGVSVELLPGCGHFLHREQPDILAQGIIDHWQSLVSPKH